MCRSQLLLVFLVCGAIAFASSANRQVFAQIGGGRDDDEQVAENRASGRPKAVIALTLWRLTLSESQVEADPELTAKVVDRAENLSPVVGSVSEVRELVRRMRVAGLLTSERELRMVTVDGEPIQSQIGRNQPRIVGTRSDPRSGQSNSLTMEETGILIKAEPQIDSEEFIQVSLEIGESDLEKSTDVVIAMTAEGGPTYASAVTTRQFNTTARIKSGSAVLLQSDASVGSDDPSDDKTELIILGAAVVDSPE